MPGTIDAVTTARIQLEREELILAEKVSFIPTGDEARLRPADEEEWQRAT